MSKSTCGDYTLKFIGITLRIDRDGHTQEIRDALDQRWYFFLHACDLIPVLLPNTNSIFDFLNKFPLSGVILSGGNTLSSLGGNAPERDKFETDLLERAMQKKMPVMGVCRGMQLIQQYFGSKLEPVEGHAVTRHGLTYLGKERIVNSYHHYGVYDAVKNIEVLARSSDGLIEAISHESFLIKGVMWHPERELEPDPLDVTLFKQYFNS